MVAMKGGFNQHTWGILWNIIQWGTHPGPYNVWFYG